MSLKSADGMGGVDHKFLSCERRNLTKSELKFLMEEMKESEEVDFDPPV